ncbi:ROK family protein [Candidatus Saccharibacteria bacterium]|nr:ROK family protein [Candidatus Saccharibacteria bacterium]
MTKQILTIDIGGTKIRVVQFHDTENFQVKNEFEITAPKNPDELVENLADIVQQHFSEFADFSEEKVISIATRGVVKNGHVSDLAGILDMDDFPLAERLSQQLDGNRVIVGNDTNVGALGAFSADFRDRGLYLTISTGIGAGMLVDGRSSRELDNLEIGHMKTWRNGQWLSWEELASGETFYKKYGRGEEIPADDPIWQNYAREIAVGVLVAIPTLSPDKIVIGGKMSEYFDKYGPSLRQIVAEFNTVGKSEIIAVTDQRYVVNRGAAIFALNQSGCSVRNEPNGE